MSNLKIPATSPANAMQIRRAEPDDAPTLGALVQRAIRTSNSADYAPAIIESMCANFDPDKVLERMAVRDVFAAVDDGAIIGTVSFSLPRSKLYSLFIEPRLQRSGTGQRLVRHIEQHAEGLRCTFLQLSASITARPFYERLGYETITFEERIIARPFYERLGYETITFEERINDGSTWLMRKALPG